MIKGTTLLRLVVLFSGVLIPGVSCRREPDIFSKSFDTRTEARSYVNSLNERLFEGFCSVGTQRCTYQAYHVRAVAARQQHPVENGSFVDMSTQFRAVKVSRSRQCEKDTAPCYPMGEYKYGKCSVKMSSSERALCRGVTIEELKLMKAALNEIPRLQKSSFIEAGGA